MIHPNEHDHHVRIRLQNCAQPCVVLKSESAARWALRHVAFNNGFEVIVHRAPLWEAPDPQADTAQSRCFGMRLEFNGGELELHADPYYRSLELNVRLGPDARHLRRNIPQLADELAAICHSDEVSLEALHDSLSPASRRLRPVELEGLMVA